jgi:hypothetical protein
MVRFVAVEDLIRFQKIDPRELPNLNSGPWASPAYILKIKVSPRQRLDVCRIYEFTYSLSPRSVKQSIPKLPSTNLDKAPTWAVPWRFIPFDHALL